VLTANLQIFVIRIANTAKKEGLFYLQGEKFGIGGLRFAKLGPFTANQHITKNSHICGPPTLGLA
jgi:hypothetical protein